MGSRYLTDLPAVLDSTGLVYQLEPGWETRARGSGGYNSGAPNHVMVHHTASNPSSDGQPDVNYQCYSADARPIANLYLSRTGKVWIMAAGATNTNGSGTDPCGIVPLDSMNSNAIGIEAANNGVGEPWPQAQQDAYVVLVQALCAHYGIPPWQTHTHHTYAPTRKIDPAGPSQWPVINSSGTWSEDAFVASVTATPPPPSTEDDDLEIMIINSIPQAPAMLRSGMTVKWLDPGRYTAYKNAYGLPDIPHHHADLANCHLLGPCPDGLEPHHFWTP